MAPDQPPAPAAGRANEGKHPLVFARRTSVGVGLLAVALVGWSLIRGPRAAGRSWAAPTAAREGPNAQATSSAAEQLARVMAELEALPKVQGTDFTPILEALEAVQRSTVGSKLPDGRDPPRLPDDAPKAVRLGVVLVRYRGAQLAPEKTAPKDIALVRAKHLASRARADFAAAVSEADEGSSVDIGAVKRGVLEAGTEYVVFTLPVGAISEILDTPRGFWIVRRIR